MPMIRSATVVAALAGPASAQGMTQSDVLEGNLLPGWQMTGGAHMAALDLRLAPQWKTYWRAPGDAGIPPSFDWSGSENVASVRFHWPAPDVFHTNGMQSVGYHDHLVLPFEVTARDPSRPVVLRAQVELGVCKDICMPASLTLETRLMSPGSPDPAIHAALKARPATSAEAGMGMVSCKVEPIRDGLRVTAEVDLPQQGSREVVVMEPGLAGVWVSQSQVSRQGARLTAVADMVPPSGAPFALDRSAVVLTVIGSAGRAVEIKGCPAP